MSQHVEEKHYSDDGKAYNFAEFLEFCGEENGNWFWSQALPEKRISDDAKPYTLKQFIDFCGSEDGKWFWSNAVPAPSPVPKEVVTASAAPPRRALSPTAPLRRALSPTPRRASKNLATPGSGTARPRSGSRSPAPNLTSGDNAPALTPDPKPAASNSLTAPSAPKQSRSVSPAPFSGDLEKDVTAWIEEVSGEKKGEATLMDWLKDGQVLCRFANKIKPNICPRINSQAMPFKQMENVSAFSQACRQMGVLEKDVFSTVDLYEAKNPQSVMSCIYSLGGAIQRTVPEFEGPFIGVAQNASVKDKAREKVMATGDSGFRKDIDDEIRGGVSRGRQI